MCAGYSYARRLRVPEEDEIEGREDQDNADVHEQPFPEEVSEEREVDSDDDGDHGDEEKYDSYLSVHGGTLALFFTEGFTIRSRSATMGKSGCVEPLQYEPRPSYDVCHGAAGTIG